MSPVSDDVLAVLKQFEAEADIQPRQQVPDGIYHVTLEDGAVQEKQDSAPRYRYQFKILCGPQKGRAISDFVGWFGSDAEKTKAQRGILVGKLEGLTQWYATSNGGAPARLAATLAMLPRTGSGSAEYDAWVRAARAIQEVFMGTRLYTSVKTNEKGLSNTYIVGPGKKGAACECSLSAIVI